VRAEGRGEYRWGKLCKAKLFAKLVNTTKIPRLLPLPSWDNHCPEIDCEDDFCSINLKDSSFHLFLMKINMFGKCGYR
jgi:hypothetical protein